MLLGAVFEPKVRGSSIRVGEGDAIVNRPWEATPIARALHWHGWGGRGGSLPLLAATDIGEIVHLKLQANPQSTRSLVNDWIGTQLGRALGVPVPRPLLVSVEFADIATFPILRSRRWRPGLQFATRWVPQCRRVMLPWATESLPSNYADIPLIVLFELWLDNHDLKISHLRLCGQPDRQFLLVTDHGYMAGGARWTPRTLKQRRYELPQLRILEGLMTGLPSPLTCQDAVARMQQIRRNDLVSVVRSVPAEWGLSPSHQAALVDFLMARLPYVPSVARRLERWAVDRALRRV